MSEPTELLGRLWVRRTAMQKMLEKKQKKIDVIMESVRPAIGKIERSFEKVLGDMAAEISELETEIKEQVLEMGHSVVGDDLIAIYQPGRRSVNMDKLEGLAMAVPQVREIITVGNPYVQINPKPGRR